MPLSFDHIGLVVPALADGHAHLAAFFGIREWTAEFDDEINQVRVQFGRDPSGMCYELIAPLGEQSPITRALHRGERVLNHVAYICDDFLAASDTLRNSGCIIAGPAKPAIAYGGSNIQFFFSSLGFLIELIDAPGHQHVYYQERLMPAT